MFYLRKEPYEQVIPPIKKTDGTTIPERIYMTSDRAIYKAHDISRYYRGGFKGLKEKYQGMKVYTCKTLKTILALRQSIFNYCGEWFDVFNENGKVTEFM